MVGLSVKIKPLICGILAVALLCVAGVSDAYAKKSRHVRHNNTPAVNKYAEIVIDAHSGAVLSEENADAKRHPASLTKMMTLFLTFEALDNGNLNMNERIFVSKRAAAQAPSKIGLRPGQSISVRNAILAVVTKSANDISVTLAEAVGGSEAAFVERMNRKAAMLGMRNTHFVNPHGLHNSKQVTTARDIAILARSLMQYYPHHYHFFSTKSFAFNGAVYANHNHLMKSYDGMDGLKTGYTVPSGFNLAASAVRDDRRLIGVVLGGKSANSRNEQMRKLLDSAFLNFNNRYASATAAGRTVYKSSVSANTSAYAARIEPSAAASSAAQGDIDDNAAPSQTAYSSAPSPIKRALSPVKKSKVKETSYKSSSKTAKQKTSAKTPVKKDIKTTSASKYNATGERSWGIQLGAFKSRSGGESTLKESVKRIGYLAQKSSPVISPAKGDGGVIFRARIVNMTKDQAEKSCRLLNSCLVFAVR